MVFESPPMNRNHDIPMVPAVEFDTSDLAVTDRYDAWRQNIGVFFDLAPADGGLPCTDIAARIHACNLGATVLGVTKTESQIFERSAHRLGRDDLDHVLVQVFLEGGGTTEGNETIVAGDMLVIDMGQEHRMLNTDFENLTLVLPRNLNPKLTDVLTPLHARQLSAENPMVRLMAGHLRALWASVPDMNIVEARTAISGTMGLMEGWLSERGQLEAVLNPEASAALGKTIRRYIESHLSEPLTPETLAATFRISRTQLYRIFALDDGVSRFIWEKRLRRSMRLLSQPGLTMMSIGTIAMQCGFTTEAHFSRSFRARFGRSPTEVRQEAIGALQLKPDAFGPEDTMLTRFPNWVRRL